jgi:hypothetical protein
MITTKSDRQIEPLSVQKRSQSHPALICLYLRGRIVLRFYNISYPECLYSLQEG